MKWTLEVIPVPVTDVDRAKSFYRDQLGFHVDLDTDTGAVRLVQLTPAGSGCSIHIGSGITPMAPGSLHGLQLVVADLPKAHAELLARGVEVTEIGIQDRTGWRSRTPEDRDLDNDNIGFFYLDDPDGNRWAVQQISTRA